MEHLSFFWLPNNKDKLIQALESEFAQLVEQSISTGKISLPPIPDVVIKIQKLCIEENTTVSDVANCLLEDPGLAAIVIRVANSVIFNRRNITCSDLTTAVSRLGIFRVRDIVTAQAIEQLKHAVNLSKECNDILVKSAAVSRELGATMVLVVQEFHKHEPSVYTHLELEKALLVGLLADIGLFCLINEYHLYLDSGNYLDPDIALQIFQTRCSTTSKLVLERWGFDNDFREVSSNEKFVTARPEVSYLDIARIANHLLMFRNQDERIDEHEVEFNLTGAEVLYDLSNMSDTDFQNEINAVLSASGL
ncbi:TPA: HDOD domain-containing protein [Vibrio parahaemolyticus]|uniref:HDOD domain-containing protein n=2 Tax=Vibrio parahaemolyticus TaxID=670 RepID=UPI0010EAA5BE|nr:HDOD domain-containing protein [Vibrio parahaemolyticus]MBE4055335.1 HDOD domain-containing protein [Vibrio parahaemolyticus]MBE4091962.1 HDOD domain-containing protein [Vibrio parahaemolyticus]MBE4264487.1 HDOD domain-containing protein [Vibrio parahaemolyticus]MBE4334136.1 HDOD domain-containing protein [Vibrio parahaemolyticus]MBE4356167.1 HDOD domain-containing protein [Vibrio parahaemolyticus]